MEIPYTSEARPDTGLYNAKVGIWLFLASEVMLFGALFSSYILLRVGAAPGTWPHGLLNIPIGTFNTWVLITSSVTVVLGWASLKMGNLGRFKICQAITIACALGFLGIKSIEYKDKFSHYQVWLKDGTTFTGHIEGTPYFWKTETLKDKKIDKFVMHADAPPVPAAEMYAHHSAAELAAEKKEEAHEHHEITVQTADVVRLSAFVPAHSTYFAIYFTLTALHGLHVFGGMLVMLYLLGPGTAMWKTDPERFTNRIEVSGLFWHFVDLVWIFLFPVLYLL